MPFSIIGSTQDVVTADGRTVKGREYLWGVAEGASNTINLALIRQSHACSLRVYLLSQLVATHSGE